MIFPNFSEEHNLRQSGYKYIAGVDEVGRGPLAGPVMAAAVILPIDNIPDWSKSVRDSKKLSERQRELLYDSIISESIATGVGSVNPANIDIHGIGEASRMAMRLAIQQLHIKPDFVLIDAVKLPDVNIAQKSIIRGDSTCISIAAASIIAKVTRDHYMMGIDNIYSNYGFAKHKGYPTKAHMDSIDKFGVCPIHRRSFSPVKNAIERSDR
ncbi:MAG: ribonuclease HII [Chloroflexi bacterium]|jgi:ribonuclease HII|nr:ribonuclease HII [Chloroflexota bacterium]MBT7081663.1 ribonuclease HII [Chloroflexota bacterium]MBT7290524.1 ribonuclease HII [Chloroflexota bacterium]